SAVTSSGKRLAELLRSCAKLISRVIMPAIDSTHTATMPRLEANIHKNILYMTGHHPSHVKGNYKDELDHVEQMLAKRKFYAIGEIGIDLYWDKSTLSIQTEAFEHQIKLAKQYQLPIVIHCREAFDEIFEVLEAEKS